MVETYVVSFPIVSTVSKFIVDRRSSGIMQTEQLSLKKGTTEFDSSAMERRERVL